MSDLTREEQRRLRSEYSMTEHEIKDYQKLIQEYRSSDREELLQMYRSAGKDASIVREQLSGKKKASHNKFLVSYDLMPDGTVKNYCETPIE